MALVAMSTRLEQLWQQVDGHAAEPGGWLQAHDRLLTAMSALEGYAGRLRPDLGRRDWRSRGCGPIPPQRSMPVRTSTRS
jgi:hypothetical protein